MPMNKLQILAFATLAVAILAAPPSAARGDFSVSGDVGPVYTDGILAADTLYVGRTGLGEVAISGKSEFFSGDSFLGSQPGSTGLVSINGLGAMWRNSWLLYAGFEGRGEIEVASGGLLESEYAYLGFAPGSSGSVVVTGAGSTWSNLRTADIGHEGHGVLEITNGARFDTPSHVSIAAEPGSSGTVTVSGAGSRLATPSLLYVGRKGDAVLNIADDALVEAGHTIVAEAASASGRINFDNGELSTSGLIAAVDELTGKGVINTRGLVSDVDLVFDTSHDFAQTLRIDGPGQEITLNLNGDTHSVMGAGCGGSGSMHVADGVTLQSYSGYLGYRSGSSGTASITGPGTVWNSRNRLYVGYYGRGVLNITDGAKTAYAMSYRDDFPDYIAYFPSYLGYGTGSEGTVTVSGVGSRPECGSHLYVGNEGSGVLNIADGGAVYIKGNTIAGHAASSHGEINFDNGSLTTGGLVVAAADLHGVGVIETRGLVSDLDMVFDSPDDLRRTFTLTGPGKDITIEYTADIEGILGAGCGGVGSLRISNGMDVQSGYGYLGYQPGSSATATISGDGSQWTSSEMIYVGHDGDGLLEVTDGGSVNCKGTVMGHNAGSHGSVTVSGGESKSLDTAAVYVGNGGHGEMNISDNAAISILVCKIGRLRQSTGVVRVSGAGTSFTVSRETHVGQEGDGALNVTDGGVLESKEISVIGGASGSSGAVTVSGTGSSWTISGDLIVGDHGNGVLNVESGGVADVAGDLHAARNAGGGGIVRLDDGVVNTRGFLGDAAALRGVGVINANCRVGNADMVLDDASDLSQTTSLTGPGRNVTLNVDIDGSGPLGAGYGGTGSLVISDGLEVRSSSGYLGFNSESHGSATVTGEGSEWISGDLQAGRGGHGVMNVVKGARVNSRDGVIGAEVGGEGYVTVSGAGSNWTTARLTVGDLGYGALVVNDGGSVDSEHCSIARNIGPERSANTDRRTSQSLDGSGSITVSGVGSTLTCSKGISVSGAGDGVMRIIDGGVVVSNASGVIGGGMGLLSGGPGTGVVTVSGVGSRWTVDGGIAVGYEGVGRMEITDGGTVVSREFNSIDGRRNSPGVVAVSGTGSSWVYSDTLLLGNWGGHARMEITAGGTVVGNVQAVIGGHHDSRVVVTVSGVGSTWICPGPNEIGSDGGSRLEILDGGTVVSGYWSEIGGWSDSTAVITVKGTGSTLTCSGGINLDSRGGRIEITDGGLVSLGGRLESSNHDEVSRITIDSGGMLALTGQTNDSLADFLGLIDGTGNIRYWDQSAWDWRHISGAVPGEDYTLAYITEGDLAGYTVLTVHTVPEPATLILAGIGGLVVLRRPGRGGSKPARPPRRS